MIAVGITTALSEILSSIGLSGALLSVVTYTILAAATFGLLSVLALVLVWWERKVAGHMQQRFGPMRNGWHGWYQTLMDGLKLLQKEDIRVETRDKEIGRASCRERV